MVSALEDVKGMGGSVSGQRNGDGMADELDHLQVQEDFLIHLQIQTARKKSEGSGISLTFCERCGNDIPPGRQRAVPGVRICTECQSRREIQGRHYLR